MDQSPSLKLLSTLPWLLYAMPTNEVRVWLSCSIVVRKSRYDLGKSFFTNLTPGYQLYPAVFLLNWLDPNKPGEAGGGGGCGCGCNHGPCRPTASSLTSSDGSGCVRAAPMDHADLMQAV